MNAAFRLLTSLLTVVLIGQSTLVDASLPRLNIIVPRGVQRGVESELTFSGQRLEDAEEIFFYEPGIEVVKIEPVNANSVKATVKVSPDCRLGEHTAQVRTKSGISDYRTFYVGALATVEEKEPNSDFATPQAIELNVTVSGIVQNEDVDYFTFQAKKGQRISAEVEAMRLGSQLFDPYLAILDSKRFELAAADDTPLVYQDAAVSVVIPEDGQYVIEVRESAYGGNGNSRYNLHVGTFPRPTAVYPAGGKVGEELDVRFLGDAAGEFSQRVKLPAQIVPEYGLFATTPEGIAPSANPFRLFEHGNVLEVEPNNDFKTATPAELPLAFNGILQEDGDVDCFRFAAKKGQVFELECYARRIRSPLDPVINVYTAEGRSISGNDDSRGPDSYLRLSVPADGEYIVRVADHLGRGGENFVYRLEFTPIEPGLTVSIPRVARYSQERQTIFVAQGNRFATPFTISRRNIGGEIVFEPEGLPEGITMVTKPVPASMNSWPAVFEAKPDAPVGGKLVDFTGRLNDPEKKVKGHFTNKADLVRGAPGQSIYWTKDVTRLAVAVVEKLPYRIEIVQPKVPIVRNGAMQLKVVAHREEGFDEEITLQFPFRPPGISGSSSVKIPKGQSEGTYPINANGSAPIGEWPIYVIGSANVNGPAYVASQLATLEISEPFLQFALDRAAVEQGQQTEIFGKITHSKPFEGAAKVQMLGLPNKVQTEELEFTKDTEELTFRITTDPSSPAGRHKSVFCQVVIMQNGEPIIHRNVGGTELRIDKPLPEPVAKKEEPKKPEPAKVVQKEEPKPQPKRLSRLEQLRLEAEQRAKEAAAAAGSE